MRDLSVILDCAFTMLRTLLRSYRSNSFISIVWYSWPSKVAGHSLGIDYLSCWLLQRNVRWFASPVTSISSACHNAATQIVAGLDMHDIVSQAMMSLHWLPVVMVVYHIRFKHVKSSASWYMWSSMVRAMNILLTWLHQFMLYELPYSRTNFGDRVFYVTTMRVELFAARNMDHYWEGQVSNKLLSLTCDMYNWLTSSEMRLWMIWGPKTPAQIGITYLLLRTHGIQLN